MAVCESKLEAAILRSDSRKPSYVHGLREGGKIGNAKMGAPFARAPTNLPTLATRGATQVGLLKVVLSRF